MRSTDVAEKKWLFWSPIVLSRLACHTEDLTLHADDVNKAKLNQYLRQYGAYLEHDCRLAKLSQTISTCESSSDHFLKKEFLELETQTYYLIQPNSLQNIRSLWQPSAYSPNIYLIRFKPGASALVHAFCNAFMSIGIFASGLPGPCLAIERSQLLATLLEQHQALFLQTLHEETAAFLQIAPSCTPL